MANKRNPKKGSTSRDAGGFAALPWSVLDSAAYAALSHPARGLLIEFARQYCRDNNGRLLASYAYLKPRGWNSADVITRARNELVEGGFIHQTVMGHRPNKASWYAVTWLTLDRLPGYDVGAAETFKRSAYLSKNASLRPGGGVGRASIAPGDGVRKPRPRPGDGAIKPVLPAPSTPPAGNHLEMPSTDVVEPAFTDSAATEPTDTGDTDPTAPATAAMPVTAAKLASVLTVTAAPPAPAIDTLATLWARVGCRVPLVARQAQQRAMDRHRTSPRRKVAPVTVRMDEDGYTRIRDEHAHDVSDWN